MGCGKRLVYLEDKLLELRAKSILTMFMKRPGKVFTKQEIYNYYGMSHIFTMTIP